MDHEALLSALWTAVTAAPGFRTSSRRLEHWSSVTAQPALYMGAVSEVGPTGPSNLPSAVEVKVELWLYTRGEDKGGDPQKSLVALQDAIARTLRPSAVTNTCTLGGCVINARLKWSDDTAPGHTDGQAVAVGEVELLTLGGCL
jgi:hypothetical protein